MDDPEEDDELHCQSGKTSCCKPHIIPIAIVSIFISVVILYPVVEFADQAEWERTGVCDAQCNYDLVESLPINLTFPAGSPHGLATFDAWMQLMDLAENRLDMAAFYWTLRGDDVGCTDPSDWQGERVFDRLQELGAQQQPAIRIAQNAGRPSQSLDSALLADKGLASVRSLNFSQWFGGGVLHTKMWVADDRHAYVGSANMDWRSLTQVKELGVIIRDCPCLVSELAKLFSVYWFLGKPGARIPARWSLDLATRYNAQHPLVVTLNGTRTNVYFSSSPAPFCPKGREVDLDAITTVIGTARRFVHIAVMDYAPTTLYLKHNKYFAAIDDAIRASAFERGVQVRVLCSNWTHTKPAMLHWLQSLEAINPALHHHHDKEPLIQVKLFHVPSTGNQSDIPFARVNHNKYMVTDNTAYIGTSNWSGDYFTDTAGVGVVMQNNEDEDENKTTPADALNQIFMRDWQSSYARPLADFL